MNVNFSQDANRNYIFHDYEKQKPIGVQRLNNITGVEDPLFGKIKSTKKSKQDEMINKINSLASHQTIIKTNNIANTKQQNLLYKMNINYIIN